MESADQRKNALKEWLSTTDIGPYGDMQPMQGDASSRRYFRIFTSQRSFILMDAPPLQENCHAYVSIAQALHQKGLHTPEIIAANIDQGFLVISDLGDTTYLKALNSQNADQLYLRALNALTAIQACDEVPMKTLPLFSREFMLKEWEWHKEWFLDKLLGLSLIVEEEKALDDCYKQIVEMATNQPQVFMHRDYHSANLMVLPNDVGILDFQDAFKGPVTYDLVSLLRDCYIDWPEEQVRKWALTYHASLIRLGVLTQVDQQTFLQWFDWMGVQRHLKALFTFARKKIRDQQSQYLNHVPRTLHYLQSVSGRYPELAVLHDYLRKKVLPAVERVLFLCEL
jgi:aminoglycoside/choline kinase family phosphotransferase